MKISEKSIRTGVLWALFIAFAASAVPAFMDWRLNPGGLFRSGAGTHWGIVIETMWTWFWPVFLLVVPVTVLLHAWWQVRK